MMIAPLLRSATLSPLMKVHDRPRRHERPNRPEHTCAEDIKIQRLADGKHEVTADTFYL